MPEWACGNKDCTRNGSIKSFGAFMALVKCNFCGDSSSLQYRQNNTDRWVSKETIELKNIAKQRRQQAESSSAGSRDRSKSPERDTQFTNTNINYRSRPTSQIKENASFGRLDRPQSEEYTSRTKTSTSTFKISATNDKWCLLHHGKGNHTYEECRVPFPPDFLNQQAPIAITFLTNVAQRKLRLAKIDAEPRNAVDTFIQFYHLHELLRGAAAYFANRDHILMAVISQAKSEGAPWLCETLQYFEQSMSTLFDKLFGFVVTVRKKTRSVADGTALVAVKIGSETAGYDLAGTDASTVLGLLFDMDAAGSLVPFEREHQDFFKASRQWVVDQCRLLQADVEDIQRQMMKHLQEELWLRRDKSFFQTRKAFLALLDTSNIVRDQRDWCGVQCIEWPSLKDIFSDLIDVNSVTLPHPEAEARQYSSEAPAQRVNTTSEARNVSGSEEGGLREIKKEN